MDLLCQAFATLLNTLNCRVHGKRESCRHPTSLLLHHCKMFSSMPLRFARSFRLAQMHPTIPSIDFSPFLRGSAGDRQRIASAVDEALSSVGFIRLHNHGIEQRKVDACFQRVS